MAASIKIDQARPGGSPSPGTAGLARNDLWRNMLVSMTSSGGGTVATWQMLFRPSGSSAVLSTIIGGQTSFTPDLLGTYRVQLSVDDGLGGNKQIKVARVRLDSAGNLSNRGLVLPAPGELDGESNYASNDRGWDEPIEQILNYILSITASGDTTATYLTLSPAGNLDNERTLSISGTSGLVLTDAGPGSTATLKINDNQVATISGSKFTGPVSASAGLSGSLQRIGPNLPYLLGGNNITIATASNGQITITSTASTASISGSFISVAMMTSSTGITNQAVSLLGYYTPGDRGGGAFYWSASSTETPDSGSIFQVAGITTGRWKRLMTDEVHVEWFGGQSNASYFSNGKWFTDSGFTTEASDDTIKFKLALACAANSRITKVKFGPGDWYFKTKLGATSSALAGNEFVRWQSGIDLQGAGRGNSIIHVGPSMNTVVSGGYSAVFGCIDFNTHPVTCSNVTFSDFTVNHNGSYNLFYTTTAVLDTTFAANCAVGVINGSTVKIERCGATNIDSTFVFLLGAYGGTDRMKNFAITDCVLEQFCNDPNLSDASYIACGAQQGVISRNICNGIAPFGTASIPFTPWSAFEIHGKSFIIADNVANGFNGAFNVGADSDDLDDVIIHGNISRNCTAGLDIFQDGAKTFKRCNITNNIFEGGWYGILMIHNFTDTPGTIQDLEISNNTFSNPAFHAGANFAVKILAASSGSTQQGGIYVHDNHAVGYADGGLILGVSNAATVLDGLNVTNNWLEQCGTNAIYITAPASGSKNIKRLWIDSNIITNYTGTMAYGIKVDANCDTTCLVGTNNQVSGALSSSFLFDTSRYANNAVAFAPLRANALILTDLTIMPVATSGQSTIWVDVNGDTYSIGADGTITLLASG